jgi:hypothetical protein
VLFVGVGLILTNSANRAQQRFTERGQVTERFGRAIDQLGSDKLDVRLGGIYALERLLRDSPTDELNLIEVLSAFIRDHAGTSGDASPHAASSMPRRWHPATDVQAALTVIGRRPNPAHAQGIDLSGANISGAKLAFLDLAYVNLNGADLSGADLDYADLAHANLAHTNLTRASLAHADLPDADLERANLSQTDLTDAILRGAILRGAILRGTILSANAFEARS